MPLINLGEAAVCGHARDADCADGDYAPVVRARKVVEVEDLDATSARGGWVWVDREALEPQQVPPLRTRKKASISESVPMSPSPLKSALVGAWGRGAVA